MEENQNPSASNDPLESNNENGTQQPESIKHKSKISQKGLLILQYAAWLMGIISLIDIIIIAVAPAKVASLIINEQLLDPTNSIFKEVSPHFSILLIVIALLFYIISRLLRTMIRYRDEINQLQDLKK
ncbi:MAG: hypothetical protein PHR53_09905 [Bacteroidales bacterium]|nr:hypothetical protein [Bacteroidales bacterium]